VRHDSNWIVFLFITNLQSCIASSFISSVPKHESRQGRVGGYWRGRSNLIVKSEKSQSSPNPMFVFN